MPAPLIGAAAAAAARLAAKKVAQGAAKKATAKVVKSEAKRTPGQKMTLKEIKEYNNFISSLNARNRAQLDAGLKKSVRKKSK